MSQEYIKLKQRLLREKRLFVDPQFPANSTSLHQPSTDIKWLRPKVKDYIYELYISELWSTSYVTIWCHVTVGNYTQQCQVYWRRCKQVWPGTRRLGYVYVELRNIMDEMWLVAKPSQWKNSYNKARDVWRWLLVPLIRSMSSHIKQGTLRQGRSPRTIIWRRLLW